MNYFDKIPTITYNNYLSKNILARARLSDKVRKQKTAFYPYTMDSNDRMDHVSNFYYDSPAYTWLIWLTNNHIDPYFDGPLSEQDLVEHIKAKYGSYTLAARKIYYYRNNWYDFTDTTLTVSQYNSLANGNQKYYEPVLDNVLNVASYKRKRHDEKIATNKIVTLGISSVVGTFKKGEEVQTDGTNYAFMTYVDSTTMTCQHVTGTLSGTITGQESGATATVGTVTTIMSSISVDDTVFWSPVTYLDHEQELNEAKKIIKLLDVRYKGQAEQDLRRMMLKR
jgi:hypothetical protein